MANQLRAERRINSGKDGKSIHRWLATRDGRLLRTDPERVRFLRAQGFGPGTIAAEMNLNINNVKRWLKSPTTGDKKGRPKFLTDEEEDLLLAFVQEADGRHDAMSIPQICQKVRDCQIFLFLSQTHTW